MDGPTSLLHFSGLALLAFCIILYYGRLLVTWDWLPRWLRSQPQKRVNSMGLFKYPEIVSLQDFDLASALPIPYRPFRWGPNYHVTMGLRQAEWDEWIELDREFARYHYIKEFRMKSRGERVVRTLEAHKGIGCGVEAARELVHELSEYLSARYPTVYSVTRHLHRSLDYGWQGKGQISNITIIPLGKTYNLDEEDSMSIAGLLVQDDLAVLLPGPNGKYYFQAGSICLAGSWRLQDKIGMPLAEIHNSADVPQYKQKLEMSMDRYFEKLKSDRLVLRHNYQFQVLRDLDIQKSANREVDAEELAWSTSGLGDEDAYRHAVPHHPASREAISDKQPLLPKNIYFRTERQSLRKLPRTGAIVFTIRTYMEPVSKLAAEPGVPGRMASAVRSWPPDVAGYKGLPVFKDILLSYLDDTHNKQLENGIEVLSLPYRYPY